MLRSKAVPGTPQTAVVASLGVALGCQCVAASRRSIQRPARWGRILPSQNRPRRDAGALWGRWVLPLPHPHAPFSDEGCPGGGCSPGDASEKGFAVPAAGKPHPPPARRSRGGKGKRQKWGEIERNFTGQGREQQQVRRVEADLCLQPKRLKHPRFRPALTPGMFPVLQHTSVASI